MRSHSWILPLSFIGTVLAFIAGCSSTHDMALQQQGSLMVVSSQSANFYQGNQVIGRLPVGTQITVLEQGDPWSKVEVYIQEYDLRVQGSMIAKELVPLAKDAEIRLEASENIQPTPALASLRGELWQEFLPGLGINTVVRSEDAIWIGTDEGLYRFAGGNPQAQQVFDSSDGLIDDAVLAIAPDGDTVWLGTFMGLSRFEDNDFVNYTTHDGLLKGAVMALDVTPTEVWLGLTSGIAKYDKEKRAFQNWPHGGGWSPEAGSGSAPGSSKNAIYADSLTVQGNQVWHAAFNITATDRNGKDLKTYGCGDGLIHSRVVDFFPDGTNVWCATINGITLLDTTIPKKYERFYTNRGPKDNPIVAAARDGNSLWVAYKEGLSQFDLEKKKFTTYYAVWDLFGGRYISTLAVDPQYLWVGTADGLWRMNKALADRFSDEGLVDDFESPSRVRHRGWPVHSKDLYSNMKLSIDDKGGANGTQRALQADYAAPDYQNHSLAHIGVDLANLDFTDADGIRFYIRAEPAVQLRASVSEDRESWTVGSWNVPSTWMEVKVPFSQFQVHAQGSGNRILELYAMSRLSFSVYRAEHLGNKPAPGQQGSIWLDEIQFYKEERPSLASR